MNYLNKHLSEITKETSSLPLIQYLYNLHGIHRWLSGKESAC